MTGIYDKYFNNKIFQESLIKLLISIDKTDLIKSKTIYLSSILDVQDVDFIKKMKINIDFDIDSMYSLYKLLCNKKLIQNIKYKNIFTHVDKIVKKMNIF